MPHLILDDSSNLVGLPDFRALLGDIHQALQRIGGIRLDNLKKRAQMPRSARALLPSAAVGPAANRGSDRGYCAGFLFQEICRNR